MDGYFVIILLWPTVTWRSFLPFTGGFRNKYLSTLTNIPDWWRISRPAAAAALVAWEWNFGSICWSKLDDLLHKSINVLFPSPQGGRFCRSCCCSVVLCYVSTKLDRVCRLSIWAMWSRKEINWIVLILNGVEQVSSTLLYGNGPDSAMRWILRIRCAFHFSDWMFYSIDKSCPFRYERREMVWLYLYGYTRQTWARVINFR